MFRTPTPANVKAKSKVFLEKVASDVAVLLLISGPLLNGLAHVVTCITVFPKPLNEVPGVHEVTHLPETLTEAESKSVTTTCFWRRKYQQCEIVWMLYWKWTYSALISEKTSYGVRWRCQGIDTAAWIALVAKCKAPYGRKKAAGYNFIKMIFSQKKFEIATRKIWTKLPNNRIVDKLITWLNAAILNNWTTQQKNESKILKVNFEIYLFDFFD